jgi:predicted dehydrogenase
LSATDGTSTPVSVVCVGAGWATGERHLPALVRDRRVSVLGVVDPHLERARALAARYDLPHAGTDLDEPWARSASAVTVGAPPWAHGDLVEDAIERGWHCLCEKPFVLPSERGVELARRAAAAGLVLAVVHNFQFSRAGGRLFAAVESGRLGELESVYGFQLSNQRRRLPHWHASLAGGLFLDETAHLLYLTRRVLGALEPRVVDARLRDREIRDLTATFEHATVWATLSLNFNASISEWQFVVAGSKAVAAFDLFRDILVVVPNDKAHGARDVLRSSGALLGGHAAGFVSSGLRMARGRLSYGNDDVVTRFVDAISGDRSRIAGMSAEDGCAVVECLEALVVRAGIEAEA